MRHYETVLIINPNLSDDDHKEVVKKYDDLIAKEKGVVVKIDEWGKQRLAYELKRFDKGAYVLMEYCGEHDLTKTFARALKLDDRVLKFQTIKLADRVDPESLIKQQTEAEQEPEAAEAETEDKAEEQKPDEATVAPEDQAKETEEVKNGVS
jgi:small subunit ribosomal protein S6